MKADFLTRLQCAIDSLEGLSVGDAFGEGFFMSWELAARLMGSGEFEGPPFDFQDEFVLEQLITPRRTDFLPSVWRWTDDTAMALEIVENLRQHGQIEPDSLAQAFSRRYHLDPIRAYGGAMHSLLPRLHREDWRLCAPSLFNNQGSYGNGAAMRAAPIGAFFADDLGLCIENARISALVTHSHSEGIAGAVAVALGAAFIARLRENWDEWHNGFSLLELVIEQLPESQVRAHLEIAATFPHSFSSQKVASIIGSGDEVTAQDTVPFCLWCAQKTLVEFEGDFAEAMWQTVAGLGDRDTTCAIVGGLIGAFCGTEKIPTAWRESRERLA